MIVSMYSLILAAFFIVFYIFFSFSKPVPHELYQA